MSALAAGLVTGAGVAVVWWRPCDRLDGRHPRLAVAVMLAALAAVWVGSLGLAVAVLAPDAGGFAATCQTVWARVASGRADAVGIAVAAGWLVALPGRGLWAAAVTGRGSRRLVRLARCVGETPARPPTGQRVRVVPGLGTPAVSLGLLRPLIALDAEFWQQATPTQRAVVLAHETAHARGRHAPADALARVLTAGLAPLPGAAHAHDCVRRHLEALADDTAAADHGPAAVGQALAGLALAHAPRQGMGSAGSTVWRAQRLLRPPDPPGRARLATLAALLAVLLVGASLVTSTTVLALVPFATAGICPV